MNDNERTAPLQRSNSAPEDPERCIWEWTKDHAAVNMGRDCVLVRKMREGGLEAEQILIALRAIESTCNFCWDTDEDAGWGCTCRRDD